jgi:hypothetical protein
VSDSAGLEKDGSHARDVKAKVAIIETLQGGMSRDILKEAKRQIVGEVERARENILGRHCDGTSLGSSYHRNPSTDYTPKWSPAQSQKSHPAVSR